MPQNHPDVNFPRDSSDLGGGRVWKRLWLSQQTREKKATTIKDRLYPSKASLQALLLAPKSSTDSRSRGPNQGPRIQTESLKRTVQTTSYQQ